MQKILITPLGGSPEPVIASIARHQPHYVVFLVSQQSMDMVGRVKEGLKSQQLCIEDYKFILDDANDLLECYEKALLCARHAQERLADGGQIVVDFTAGAVDSGPWKHTGRGS